MVAATGYDIHRPRELRNDETLHSTDGQDEKEYDGDELLTTECSFGREMAYAVSLLFVVLQ